MRAVTKTVQVTLRQSDEVLRKKNCSNYVWNIKYKCNAEKAQGRKRLQQATTHINTQTQTTTTTIRSTYRSMTWQLLHTLATTRIPDTNCVVSWSAHDATVGQDRDGSHILHTIHGGRRGGQLTKTDIQDMAGKEWGWWRIWRSWWLL